MKQVSGPGKSYRVGMSLFDAVKAFSDEAKVEELFIEARWPDGVRCPFCGSERIRTRPTRKPQPFRCYGCRKDFSVKTATVMHGSNLKLSKWALAIYLMSTNLKGVSSMKLHRDLGISQKAAWHLSHRIRKAYETRGNLFGGPVEIDETFVGGKERNKHADKRLNAGRGITGKTAVVGAKDRETGQISSASVPDTSGPTLREFVKGRSEFGATVYTDGHGGYEHLMREVGVYHDSVNHGRGEYVRGDVHTNGIESHWAMLKRGLVGTYHQISVKHIDRYAAEFEGRHNIRKHDTKDQLAVLIRRMDGRRLRYEDLIGPPETRLNRGA